MSVRVELGDWARLGADAGAVREAVFVVAQKIPRALEWDAFDAVSVHAVAYDGEGRPVGTGRLLPDGHVGRMAVLSSVRRDGVGSLILEALVARARALGHEALVLHAQSAVQGFYARHGFAPEGEEFVEAGIAHILMRRRLAP